MRGNISFMKSAPDHVVGSTGECGGESDPTWFLRQWDGPSYPPLSNLSGSRPGNQEADSRKCCGCNWDKRGWLVLDQPNCHWMGTASEKRSQQVMYTSLYTLWLLFKDLHWRSVCVMKRGMSWVVDCTVWLAFRSTHDRDGTNCNHGGKYYWKGRYSNKVILVESRIMSGPKGVPRVVWCGQDESCLICPTPWVESRVPRLTQEIYPWVIVKHI